MVIKRERYLKQLIAKKKAKYDGGQSLVISNLCSHVVG